MSSSDEDNDFYDAEDDMRQSVEQAHSPRTPSMAGDDAALVTQPSALIGRDGAGHQSATDEATITRARSRGRNRSATSRAESSRSSSSRSHHRYSLPPTNDPVPLIPAQYLAAGRPSLVQRTGDDTRTPRSAPLHLPRTATASYDASSTRSPNHRAPPPHVPDPDAQQERPSSRFARRKSLPALPPQAHTSTLEKLEGGQKRGDMNRLGQKKGEDLFLELANDDEEERRPPSRGERALSRLSQAGKRRSMPAADHTLPSPAERRPKSSGHAFSQRTASRLDTMSSNTQRPHDRYRNTPSRATYRQDDVASVSGQSQSGRVQRWSSMAERSPASPSLRERLASPESTQYGRRRPSYPNAQLQQPKTRQSRLPGSFDEHSESPEENSEAKQSQDSTDVDSQTDTVWDELDDLKSRIKKLELTGKLPPTPGAAVSSNAASDRPRTATTAPTTIDSSPKRERQTKKSNSVSTPVVASPADHTVGGFMVSSIHPLLHSALAKAKPLLNSNLYRTLEATASDALQLAAMTGGAGPQGTAFSAASIINGATVSDRHVRRKADTMCRNLTDLCLALCEGKLESGSTTASPVTVSTPIRNSPSVRHARSSLGPNDSGVRATGRPMSRLEARRTSILGTGSSFEASRSPHRESEDVSASEAENTPSQAPTHDYRQRYRSTSRLQVQRPQYDDVSGDEDPTIRPVSRAMTDNFRSKPSGPRDYNSPGAQRSPSLRDSLVARRANAAAHEENQKLHRVTSLNAENGRRRFLDHSTPPVVEEESTGQEAYQASSSSKRRVTSHSFANRRGPADVPSRATSLNQRRHVVVE